jgi:predicted nuclease of restriction endonuclease-like RecB superfamily
VLGKDLLRFKVAGDAVVPTLLRATPAVAALAEAILAHWRGATGQAIGVAEDAAGPVLHGFRSLVVAKGLQKLVVDACTLTDPPSREGLRERAFDAGARHLLSPAHLAAQHLAAIAADCATTPERLHDELYDDLPEAAVVSAAPAWSADELIGRYNLAQCQGLLLGARSLCVVLDDRDAGTRRRLLTQVRFRRLLAEVREDGQALALEVAGPDAVLDQASRYGVNLAQFLPALAGCRAWTATAEVSLGRGAGTARLDLSHELGLPGSLPGTGFVPPELRELGAAVLAKLDGWTTATPSLLPMPGGELAVPDLRFVAPDGSGIDVELFHRWHESALDRRLAQLAAGHAPRLAVGLDRALLKRRPGLADTPSFVRAGFAFTESPAPRSVAEVVARLWERRL